MIVQAALQLNLNVSPVIAGLSHYIIGLTTIERFEALTKLDSLTGGEKGFAVFGIAAAAGMAALFVFVTLMKRKYEEAARQDALDNLSQRMGLTDRERELISMMAQAGRIKTAYLLLADSKLFDKSAAKLIEPNASEEQTKLLKLELTFLREKLGFRKQLTLSAISRMPRVEESQADTTKPVNRRRFVRTPVRKQIFAAIFDTLQDVERGQRQLLPEFMPAVLTEIGGPGLKFESDMRVKKGDRMLVVLGVKPKDGRVCEELGTEFAHSKTRLIRDIAVVRNVGESCGQQAVAVELVGLNDNELDSLVRATNAELIRNVKGEKITADYQTQKIVSSFVRA